MRLPNRVETIAASEGSCLMMHYAQRTRVVLFYASQPARERCDCTGASQASLPSLSTEGSLMFYRYAAVAVVGIIALAISQPAAADEDIFGYTRGTEVLPQGAKEIEFWATRRSGKGEGRYTAYDYRVELEYGFTDRLKGALYLNAVQHDISGVSSLEDRRQTRFDGFSNEWRYNILSAYKDGLGLTLYFEPEYSKYSGRTGKERTEYAVDTKLLLQKNFLDDRLIWQGNLNAELAREKEDGKWEGEALLGFSSGLAYRFAPGWFGGVEMDYRSVWPELAQRTAWGLFAGPTLHYASKSWWATITWLPQIKGRPVDTAMSSRLHLDEFEKNEMRLRVGFNF